MITINPTKLVRNVSTNGEFIYQNSPELQKIKGSKVLIVGGGPSASDVDWDTEDYDYIISLNHFYKSEKLNVTISLSSPILDLNESISKILSIVNSKSF